MSRIASTAGLTSGALITSIVFIYLALLNVLLYQQGRRWVAAAAAQRPRPPQRADRTTGRTTRRRGRPSRILALVALVPLVMAPLASLALPASAEAGPVSGGRPWIMVDDDGRAAPDDCESRTRTYRRIQDALDDARPGDRISVCPGRYPEALRIGPRADDVYLATEFSFQAVLVPPPTDQRPAVDIQRCHPVRDAWLQDPAVRPDGPGHHRRAAHPGHARSAHRHRSPSASATRSDVTIRGDKIAAGPTCGYRVGIDVARSRATIITDKITDFLGRGIVAGPASDVAIAKSDVRFLHDARDQALPGSTLDPEAIGVVLDGVDRATLRTVSVFTRLPDDPDDLPSLLWAGIVIQDAQRPGDHPGRQPGDPDLAVRHPGAPLGPGVDPQHASCSSGWATATSSTSSTGARIVGDDSKGNVTGIRLGPGAPAAWSSITCGRPAAASSTASTHRSGSGPAGTANTWRHAQGRSSDPSGHLRPAG